MQAVKFTTTTGEDVDLAPGVRLVIGWAGYGGDRGAEATHRTEVVVALVDGGEAVVLTGGAYRGGAETRVLPLYRADGRPTRQVRGRA